MSTSIGRKVSVLLSGSVAAQLLPVLAAPLLTRLYTPESFGKFGLFTAAATILASFANLKFHHAGAMVQVLCVAYFLRFVFSPLSYNYYLAERHSEDLLLQCMSFGLTVVTFLATKSAGFHLLDTLVVYFAICACIYLFYGLRSMYFAWTSISNQQVAANTAIMR